MITDRSRPARPAAHRILVADEEPLIRWALTETLTEAGWDVYEAADADAAIRALSDESHAPDVVLLDHELPGATSLTLLSRIKTAAPRSQTIVMTSYGTPEIVREALEHGALRVMEKPLDMVGIPAIAQQAHDACAGRREAGA